LPIYEIRGVFHVITCTRHFSHLTRNSPTLKNTSGLVFTVVHTFHFHSGNVVDIISLSTLDKDIQVESFVSKVIGETESEVRVRIADICFIVNRYLAITIDVGIDHISSFRIYAFTDITEETTHRSTCFVSYYGFIDIICCSSIEINRFQYQLGKFISVERDIKARRPS